MGKLIFFIVGILSYYLFCICLYMVLEEKQDNKIVKKSKIINKKIDEILAVEIGNIENNKNTIQHKKNLKFIKRYLKHKNYQQLVIKHLIELENRDEISNFLNETKILDEFIYNNKQDEIKKAYFTYIIGEFKLKDKYDFLIKNCESKSIYIKVNALKSLVNLGNYDYYITGLKTILTSKTLMHKKIIIESLFDFNEINFNLNNNLIKELNLGNIELDVVIISYFSGIKYDKVSSIIYEFLKSERTNKEVIIASIRYFLQNNSIDIKDILIKLLQNSNWEVRAISATAMKNYNDEDVINALKKSITDEVWYVRQNSARSLEFLIKDKDKLFEIIDKSDKYAFDAILSVLSEENKLDEYTYK